MSQIAKFTSLDPDEDDHLDSEELQSSSFHYFDGGSNGDNFRNSMDHSDSILSGNGTVDQQQPLKGARFALILLTGINLFNYIDRYVPSATKDLIKVTLFHQN